MSEMLNQILVVFRRHSPEGAKTTFTFRSRSAREGGAAAERAASHKEEKYANIGSQYLFAPIAVETLGH